MINRFLSSILLLLFIAVISYAQVKDPPFVISVTQWQRPAGVWATAWMLAQDSSQIPPGYFVCGIALKEMAWKKNVSCGCPSACSFCLNTFYSMVNGIKVTYCRYNDWNKQIQKTFETPNSTQNSGVYKEYKCPRDTFVTKAASKFGFQYETDLGMNGIQLTCENINLNGTATVVEDPSKGGFTSPVQKGNYGHFLSAVIVKYDLTGKLMGINFGFSGVPIISKMAFEFSDTSLTPVTRQLETSSLDNTQSVTVQIMKEIKKPFICDNLFTNELPSTHDYDIDKNVVIDQYEFVDGVLLPDSRRELYPSNFTFNSMMQTRKEVRENLCIQVPSCKNVQVLTEINLSKAKTVYNVVFTFVNRLTGELIGVSGKVKGIWKGTLIESLKSKTTQTDIEGCGQPTTPNLTTA